MYLLLVGGCRASWRGSKGCKSVRRVVTSSDRKQTEPMLVLSSLPYPQSRAFTPRKGCPHLGQQVVPPQLNLFPSQVWQTSVSMVI